MEFDPVVCARSIPSMIKNDTFTEILDLDQLSECLKHITLNIDDSLYILDKVSSKYNASDGLKAICNIITDFGDGNNFDLKKFVEFIRALGRCLHIDIIDSIANIIEIEFSKTDNLCSIPQIQSQKENKNIIELRQISKTSENFNTIYEICQKIAIEKDIDAMSFAVREKFVYVREKFGYNIFTMAICENDQDLIHILMEFGFIVNLKDNHIDTTLVRASEKGHHEVVKPLLTVPGIDVNAKDDFNRTALFIASYNGHHEVVKPLLTVPGIDVNAKDDFNRTALFIASYNGHHEVVKLLLTVPGIDVNAKNRNDETALMKASYNDHHEVVKLLLKVPGIGKNA